MKSKNTEGEIKNKAAWKTHLRKLTGKRIAKDKVAKRTRKEQREK